MPPGRIPRPAPTEGHLNPNPKCTMLYYTRYRGDFYLATNLEPLPIATLRSNPEALRTSAICAPGVEAMPTMKLTMYRYGV